MVGKASSERNVTKQQIKQKIEMNKIVNILVSEREEERHMAGFTMTMS